MKLLHIANRNYIFILLIVFLLGSLIGYFVLKSIINKEFNEKLFVEKEQLIFELHTYKDLKKIYNLNIGDKIELRQVDYDPKISPTLSDTIMYAEFEKKLLPFRTLTFADQFNGDFYIVKISKSLLSNDELIRGITEMMIFVIALLAFSLIVLNRFIFKKIWSPFYHILDELKTFKISKPKPLSTIESNVDEFRELKKALNNMIGKSLNDYQNLKEYTENTTHEIQTPLAIIRNKSEMLLQEPLEEKQLTEISKIYEAAGRLSRLKEGLSTLTKIDNNQFVTSEPIQIKEFIKNKLTHVEELIQMKNIKVTTEFHGDPIIELNYDLAYIMVTNLMSNAIKHNVETGELVVTLSSSSLQIKNTGEPPGLPPEQLFDRFKRSGKNVESVGLGLSLIKRIVEYYHMTISYTFRDGWHILVIKF